MVDVLLVDGNNLAHRCWHVAGGDPQRATELVGSMIRRAANEARPAFGAVAFDSPDCFRRDLYPAYKATRGERPGDLTAWLERISTAALLVFDVATAPRFEADDVLATLTRQAVGRGLSVGVVTSDKDAYALVSDRVLIYPPGGAPVGPEDVVAKLGVLPTQVADLKALAGDRGDNIPGVPLVGSKKAVWLLSGHPELLLSGHPTLEAILASTLADPLIRRVQAHADLARLCLRLTTLRTDAPIARPFEGFRLGRAA